MFSSYRLMKKVVTGQNRAKVTKVDLIRRLRFSEIQVIGLSYILYIVPDTRTESGGGGAR